MLQGCETVANTVHARITADSNGTYIEGRGEAQMMQLNKGASQGYRVYDLKGISSTIASQAAGLGAKTGLYAVPVLTPDRKDKRRHGRRFKNDGEPAFTVNTQDRHGVMVRDLTDSGSSAFPTIRGGGNGGVPSQRLLHGKRIRRLTPRECWRLQGFPDWAFDRARRVNSDSQLYRQAGNAVTVDVIRFIGERLKSVEGAG